MAADHEGAPRFLAFDLDRQLVQGVGSGMQAQRKADGAEIVVTSNAIMVEYRQGDQRVFAGKNTHKLVRSGEKFLIASKKVELINCDDAFAGLAVPI